LFSLHTKRSIAGAGTKRPKRRKTRRFRSLEIVRQALPDNTLAYCALQQSQPCCGLNLLEPRLTESHTTVIIPFDDSVVFVSLLNCAELSKWLSEIAQTLDAISGIQFLVGGRGLGEAWLLGTV
jgi:hypothetical protein